MGECAGWKKEKEEAKKKELSDLEVTHKSKLEELEAVTVFLVLKSED